LMSNFVMEYYYAMTKLNEFMWWCWLFMLEYVIRVKWILN
jgi:hypothetical protein